MICRSFLLVSSVIFATAVAGWAVPPVKKVRHPSLIVKTGKTKAVEGRQLHARDGRGVTAQSDLIVRSHVMLLEMTVPKTEGIPEEVAAARVVVAVNASRSLPVKLSVWLPNSKIWQSLGTDYLTTEKSGAIMVSFPRPRRALAGDDVRIRLRVEDHDPGAEPFTLFVDAVALQAVKGQPKQMSTHEAAAELAGDAGPITRVHQFSGTGSSSFEQRQQEMLKSFEKPPPKPKSKPKPKKKKKKKK